MIMDIRTKLDNLYSVYNKYLELPQEVERVGNRTRHILSEISVLEEMIIGKLGVKEWENCYQEDKKEFIP